MGGEENMTRVAVVNGPNMNLLGRREPDIYGSITWEEVKAGIERKARLLEMELEFFQSNSEGTLIDYLQDVGGKMQGLVINPGALTHYGYSLRDALASMDLRKVEVHITNIYAREEWRRKSVVSPVVDAVISGAGTKGYEVALEILAHLMGDRFKGS
jgi:3-dehydroquinate dehydratase-2